MEANQLMKSATSVFAWKDLISKEWNFKEGMLIKKTEAFRIAISNLRISGRAAICDNPKGLNARIDNISYYLLNVKECSQVTYQGKKTLMVSLEGTGENRYNRYIFLPGFEEGDQLVNAILMQNESSISDRTYPSE